MEKKIHQTNSVKLQDFARIFHKHSIAGLSRTLFKFQDFPGPVRNLYEVKTKMVREQWLQLKSIIRIFIDSGNDLLDGGYLFKALHYQDQFFQNIFKFCTFLLKFSNSMPFFAVFFFLFWSFSEKSYACPYFYNRPWLWLWDERF